MSKRKCPIPKGHKLFTHNLFTKPYNYLLVNTLDQTYTWANKDLTDKLSESMGRVSHDTEWLISKSNQVIR